MFLRFVIVSDAKENKNISPPKGISLNAEGKSLYIYLSLIKNILSLLILKYLELR